MKIESLHLQNFKNLNGDFEFADGVNLLIGKNGIGKTNILEAIHFLTTGSSFRKLEDKDILTWSKDSLFSKVNANVYNPRTDSNDELSLVITDDIGIVRKNFEINGLKKKKSEYLFSFPTVIFHPHDIEILVGSPDQRRNELDNFLSLMSKKYSQNLLKYKKVLKSKNTLLKKIRTKEASKSELKFWNDQLVESGSEVIWCRLDVLQKFIPTIRSFAKEIFRDNFDNLNIGYISKIVNIQEDLSKIRDLFYSKVNSGIEKEILAGQSLYGPQRDDLQFENNTINLHKFGSRGQQRLVALIFKLAMWKYYLDTYGDNPVLLLDDMMSELDSDHRTKLSEAFLNTPAQIIFTSTNVEDFSPRMQSKSKISTLNF